MRYLFLLLTSCSIFPPPVPPDAPLGVRCDLACANLERLGADGWRRAVDGASCAEICVYMTEHGFDFRSRCVAEAATITELDACDD